MGRLRTVAVVLALAALAIPLFLGLGRSDLDGDEAIYAGVVERMVAGGSWLTPPDENGPFLEKPPLRSWIVGAALYAGLVPPTEAGHRVVDTTLSACAILYVFVIAARFGGVASGLGAVFLTVATEPLLLAHGLRSGTMEPLLVLSYCGAVCHFLRWADGGRRWHAVAVGAWVAAAVLAKFAAAAPLLVLLVVALVSAPSWRARAAEDRKAWAMAVALLVLLAVPWFVLQTVRYGFEVWGWILGHHVLSRISSFLDPGHVQPWWYYLKFIARTFRETWLYVLAGAVVLASRRRTRPEPGLALLGLWFAVPVLLFSIATSKQIHYVYPALPALSVIGGQAFGAASAWIRGRWHEGGGARVAASLLLVALGIDIGRHYARAVMRAGRESRPLGALAECVRARRGVGPAALHVHHERALKRDEKYYFARMGEVVQPEAPLDGLAARSIERGANPELLGLEEYTRWSQATAARPAQERAHVAVVRVPHHELVAFLPGDFRPCAAVPKRAE